MKNDMTKELIVCPSMADCTGRLSFAGCASLCMDLATEHAEQIGIGLTALMPQNLFWLTVRTKLHFYRAPGMAEPVTARTWPEAPERLRSVRDYCLTQNGETLVAGKSEWAVINTETGRLVKAETLFPADFVFCADRSLPEPFISVKDDFTEEPFAETVVGSADIDLGGHMNNAAYIRTLAGLFTTAEWKTLGFTELDVQFRTPCYEGNTLQWQKRQNGDITELRAACGGKTVFFASLK